MTREEKELLFKDLCARLTYGVKVQCGDYLFTFDKDHMGIGMLYKDFNGNLLESPKIILSGCYYGEDIKPYLFPLSSMTEEQIKEYYSLADDVTIKPGQGSYFGIKIHCIKLGISDNPHEGVWDQVDLDAIDWLNAHHFDYRGLIEKGLAIDATGLNIY
jgi:hypothetical protein